MEKREIPNTNEIVTFLHCNECFQELPEGMSPRDYAWYEVGYSEMGLQVWCVRHDCNIIHLDFNGQKFRANTTREA